MDRLITIDSHQHFWDPSELDMPEVPPEAAVLKRAYLPNDLYKEIKKVGVHYTICVQCYPQNLETNRWMFRQANSADFVAGVVAWVDLNNPDNAKSALDGLEKESKFVGIRHIVEDEPDINWIVQEPVLQSLKELARRDVPFDMVAKPQHLKNVLTVLDKVPDLRMVIDHIAKPNIKGSGSPGWKENMATIARNQRVYCKLSGMITEADWNNWKPSDLAPYVHHVVKIFGWDRVMFGSDWPVCLLAGDYQQVWDAINDIFHDITKEQWAKVFGENAIGFYGLKIHKDRGLS